MAPRVIIAAMLAAGLYAWMVFVSTFHHPGAIGFNYNAPGTDWMVFQAAARAYFDGNLPLVFDAPRFTAHLNTLFADRLSSPLPFHPWLYPPGYLLLLLPFGLLPFAWSYAGFVLVTLAGAVAAVAAGVRDGRARLWRIAGLVLSPAAAVTVTQGQNAFLTVALLLGGVRLMAKRPVPAGILLGLLTVKPQFWLLVPVMLVAARRWRVLGVALATALLLCVASAAVFGLEPWWIWIGTALHPPPEFRADWMEWSLLWGMSVTTCALLLGAAPGLAAAIQLAAIVAGAGFVYHAFRRDRPVALRGAVLLAAVLLAAPHVSPYDTVLLAIAATTYMMRVGDAAPPGGMAVALLLWLAPLFNPPRAVPAGFATPVLILLFMIYAIRLKAPESGAAWSAVKRPAAAL